MLGVLFQGHSDCWPNAVPCSCRIHGRFRWLWGSKRGFPGLMCLWPLTSFLRDHLIRPHPPLIISFSLAQYELIVTLITSSKSQSLPCNATYLQSDIPSYLHALLTLKVEGRRLYRAFKPGDRNLGGHLRILPTTASKVQNFNLPNKGSCWISRAIFKYSNI